MGTKNLKLSTIKKKSKEYDSTEIYEITTGDYVGEQITFYPHFSEITIEELLIEYQNIIIEKENKELKISDETLLELLHFLIIKHFTHFKKDLPDKLLGEGKKAGLLEYYEHFKKTGLHKELIEHMFLPEEIAKVMDYLSTFLANSLVLEDFGKEIQQKFEDIKLKNKFIFDGIGKIDTENKVVK